VTTTTPFANIQQHSAVNYNGDIYVLGGVVSGANTSALYKWDLTLNTWSTLASDPEGVACDHAVSVLNGLMYVVGGDVTAGGTGSFDTNAVRAYSFASNTWDATLASPSNFLSSATLHSISNDIWLHGGKNVSTRFNTSRFYDVSADSWSKKAGRPISPVSHTAQSSGQNIYIFGGFTSPTFHDEAHKYDTVTNTYTDLTSDMYPRAFSASALVNGKIYLISGLTTGSAFIDTVTRYTI
jgi:N-acetylneuraminic acid mutarotase